MRPLNEEQEGLEGTKTSRRTWRSQNNKKDLKEPKRQSPSLNITYLSSLIEYHLSLIPHWVPSIAHWVPSIAHRRVNFDHGPEVKHHTGHGKISKRTWKDTSLFIRINREVSSLRLFEPTLLWRWGGPWSPSILFFLRGDPLLRIVRSHVAAFICDLYAVYFYFFLLCRDVSL